MACRKQLFGNESNFLGSVTKASANKSVQGEDGSAVGSSEAGTSSFTPVCKDAVEICTPCRIEAVDDGLAGVGPSSSRCLLSPLPTLTASEMATPNANKLYTHKEDIDPALIPRPGMLFKDREKAREFFNSYALEVGFGLKYGNIKPYSYIIHCKNEGEWEYYKGDEQQCVRNNTTKKTHCKAKMKLKRIYDENRKEVSVMIEQVHLMHNHQFSQKKTETINMESHKEKNPELLELVDDLQAADVPNHSIQNFMSDMHGVPANIPMTAHDLENRKAANVREEHASDVGKLLEFFEDCEAQNPQFKWYVKLDKEGAIHSLFWSHASMQAEYIDSGDVMTFDTTHKTNIYEKPLAMFVGANHHLQNTYFGYALLGGETIETFQWVFQAFKKCMGKNRTKCILTDQDQAMEVAIGLEFSEVIHRICRWHVVNKHMPKLNELFELFKKQKFKDKFRSVLNHPLTPAEFEIAWEDLMTEFDLKENSTMESLYRQRARYIPAFFKDDYCGMMTSTQRSESSNHAIKNGFVGTSLRSEC